MDNSKLNRIRPRLAIATISIGVLTVGYLLFSLITGRHGIEPLVIPLVLLPFYTPLFAFSSEKIVEKYGINKTDVLFIMELTTRIYKILALFVAMALIVISGEKFSIEHLLKSIIIFIFLYFIISLILIAGKVMLKIVVDKWHADTEEKDQ